MSADLELRRDLPRIQIPIVKIETLESCNGSESDDVVKRNGNASGDSSSSDSDVGCRTPTSEEYKIPAVLCCPPAPRKPKRRASCKRKLSEFEFFDVVNSEEVESFFRSSFDSVVSKRRCMPL